MKRWVLVVDVTVEAEDKAMAEEIANTALWEAFGDNYSAGEATER